MIHRFGEFSLDDELLELRRGDAVVPVQTLPLRLISALIGLHDKVVSKHVLIDRVWDGCVVSDAAIAQAVMLARKALEDDEQTLIVTVRQRGFRFTAPLIRPGVAPKPAEVPPPLPEDFPKVPASGRDSRAVLLPAALLGRRFSTPLLAGLLECSEDIVLSELECALQEGLIEESSRVGHFEFVDENLRATLYASIPSARRAGWHQRAGELLERRRFDGRAVQELADHYAKSGSSSARQRAVSSLRRAADAASTAQSHEDAARMWDRAVEISEVDAADPAQQYELLECAAHAWYWAGELTTAVARFERALQVARWQSDARRAARAIMNTFIADRVPLFQHATQRRLCAELRALPQDDETVVALTQAASALANQDSHPNDRALATAAALERARRTGDASCIKAVLRLRHLVLLEFAHPRELHAVMDELVVESRATGDRESLLDALLSRTAHAVELGDLPLAMRDRAEYLALHASAPSVVHRYLGRAAEAADNAMAGRVEHALELSKQAAALGGHVDPAAQLHDEVRRLLYFAHQGVGYPDMAERELEQVPPDYRLFWSLVWSRQGRGEDARRVLRHFAQAGFPVLASGGPQRAYLAVAGEVSATLGEQHVAHEVFERLLPFEGQHLALYAAGVYLGPVALYLALCASACDRAEVTRKCFEQALEQTLAIGALPTVVRVRRAFAHWLEAHGELQAAATLRAAADNLGRGLGLPCEDYRLRAVAASSHGRLRTMR
ncbi:MAG: winged helix-turn-helix domain-containing protein [Myxococcales bacterium]